MSEPILKVTTQAKYILGHFGVIFHLSSHCNNVIYLKSFCESQFQKLSPHLTFQKLSFLKVQLNP